MTFRFEFPWALLLLAPVLVILLFNVLGHRKRAGGLLFPSVSLLSGMGSSWRGRLRWITIPIRLAAAVLVVLAIARPQAGEASLKVIAEGIDIVLVMDTSFSMEEQDFGGNSGSMPPRRSPRNFSTASRATGSASSYSAVKRLRWRRSPSTTVRSAS